ncbi:MAG TPA: alpha/beta fold hydrolase [Thermoanaerobaculia bacterium]|nr:alpha/beta fold hydrolase [Thermoanaerobaculia bacterium]
MPAPRSPLLNRGRREAASHEVRHHRAHAPDGVAIAYTHWRRPAVELLVLAPGFWRVRLGRENLFLANHFLRRGYDVVALDFRGHGDSGGGYAFGSEEHNDFTAVIEELVGPGRTYERFAVLGLSMGGSIAAQALAARPDLPCRALAMISSPADLRALRPKPWKLGAMRQVRLRHALRVPKLASRGFGDRKPRADEAVASLAFPKLIVTSKGDWLVDPSHGRALAEASLAPVDLVHLDLPGSLHADGLVEAVPVQLLRVLDRWFAKNAPP